MTGKKIGIWTGFVIAAFGAGFATASGLISGAANGPTRTSLGFAGKVSGVIGPVDLQFHFFHGVSEFCSIPPNNGVQPDANGSFSVEVDLSSCSGLFNGQDVTYKLDVSQGGTVLFTTTGATLEPVGYAHYTDTAASLAPGATASGALLVNGALNAQGGIAAAGTVSLPSSTMIAAATPIALSGNTGWNFNCTGCFARYWKDAVGIVHLEAVGQTTTSPASSPFTVAIPPGYRPAGPMGFWGCHAAGGAAIGSGNCALAPFNVQPDGFVAGLGNGAGVGNGESIYFNGMWFGAQ